MKATKMVAIASIITEITFRRSFLIFSVMRLIWQATLIAQKSFAVDYEPHTIADNKSIECNFEVFCQKLFGKVDCEEGNNFNRLF